MRTFWIMAIFCFVLPAEATPIKEGQQMPTLLIGGSERGQMHLGGDDAVRYGPFDSRAVIPGKVRVIIHMAARPGAQSDGHRLTDALDLATLDPRRFQVLVVVAADDCIFGTCLFIRGRLEDKVRERRTTAFVYDDQGVGRAKWGLPKETFTAILTNRAGQIVRAKTGIFTKADARAYLRDARALMAPSD